MSEPIGMTGPVQAGAQTGQVTGPVALPASVQEAASQLGRRAAGKPKNITPERKAELQAHMDRVNVIRRERFAQMASGKRVVKAPAPVEVKVASGKLVRKLPPRKVEFTTATIYNG